MTRDAQGLTNSAGAREARGMSGSGTQGGRHTQGRGREGSCLRKRFRFRQAGTTGRGGSAVSGLEKPQGRSWAGFHVG